MTSSHPLSPRDHRRTSAVVVTAVALLALAACRKSSSSVTTSAPSLSAGTPATTVRLGYFANVTHAGAVLGVAKGTFAKDTGATIEPQVFNAGPTEIESLLAGSLDAGYLGPSPAVNGFATSNGALRIVAGATKGGASLVVRSTITSAADLKGKTIADPQLGGTQDVALKTYLAKNNLTADVTVQPQDNATSLDAFKQGTIDGAWVPEPWASRIILEGGGKELVDESTLWPDGKLLTTVLVVRSDFLAAHPQTVKGLIQGQVDADKLLADDAAGSQATVNGEIKRITGKALTADTLTRAFSKIATTEDPFASSLQTSADEGVAAGVVKQVDLKGIFDLRLLDEVLGRPIDDAGLGVS